MEFTSLTAVERFPALERGNVDLLARITTWTMERDVFQADAQAGFTFSAPYFYDGLRFGGVPEYIEPCANALETSGICSELRICVNNGTTTLDRTRELFPEEVRKGHLQVMSSIIHVSARWDCG